MLNCESFEHGCRMVDAAPIKPSDQWPARCRVIISHHLQQCFGSGGSFLQIGSCDSSDLLLGDLFPAGTYSKCQIPSWLQQTLFVQIFSLHSLSFPSNPFNCWPKEIQFENGMTCVHRFLTFDSPNFILFFFNSLFWMSYYFGGGENGNSSSYTS